MNQSLPAEIARELCPAFPGSHFSGGTNGPVAIERYTAAWQVLRAAVDLSPANQDVSHVLSQLVGVLSEPFTPLQENFILNHPTVVAHYDAMLSRLNQAESAMEQYVSKRLCNNSRSQFQYMENYSELVTAELGILRLPIITRGQSIAFVGAGPLPLSAVLIAEATGCQVTCIDNDPEAVRLGQSFIERSDLCEAVRYVECDGVAYDYTDHPVVFVASLVEPKDRVIDRIRQRRGETEIAVRSAQGVHKLLYRPVCREAFLKQGVRFDRETTPDSRIINTTLFARLKPVCPNANLQ